MTKLSLLFSGAIMLSIAMFPLISYAQQERQDPALTGVELTTEQKQKVKQLQDNINSQLEAILTLEQQEKLKAAMEQSHGRQQLPNVFATLNLSQEQKNKIQNVFQSAHQQASEIFTPEQQQQIRQNTPFSPDQSMTKELTGS